MSQKKEVQQWADDAMYAAEESIPGPKVYLLQGTPDPLGSVVAFSAMYSGKVVRNKADVTDDERRYHLSEMQKTKLKAPLEAVNLHWMIEGVTRSFTHQMVRQRTAVYAQESLRFAVKEDAGSAVALPPSLTGVESLDEVLEESPGEVPWQTNEQEALDMWRDTVKIMSDNYNRLVNMGMPAEDARGLLPHAITTRLNYHTNLRNFQDHAGNRLCTQAQFEWRAVWGAFVDAMRNYCTCQYPQDAIAHRASLCDNWQWAAISDLFRPVCYYTGNCQFLADFDRKCTIRNRVMASAEIGRPSSEWGGEYDHVAGNPITVGVGAQGVVRNEDNKPVFIGAIQPAEWLTDPAAAR